MQNFILIRTYREEDKLFCKELLEASVMNQLNHTYIGILLGLNIMRIVNMLSIVLMSLLMYAGLHKIYCIMIMFIPGIILYITLYTKFCYEARMAGYEIFDIPRIYTLDNPSRFWIAEAYEDVSLNNQEQNQQYVFMTEEKMNVCKVDFSNHNKKIVGIMSVCKSNWEPTLGYIKRFYVQKKYAKKDVYNQLMKQAEFFAYERGILCIKAIVSQFEKHLISFYNTKNFTVNIIHDRSFLISITMYEYIFRTRNSHSDQKKLV
ncbi:uncharacterized protein LOC124948540 isoform X1 [Vespa velutina]|uniref:uncharacterized protein LOC124948540 isoform X1 n=1 Tax=Vespa velutina TaxID=202808 RepID=UPI001FB4C358|nr:uncharacterized protein LOC124948540 isoform X1 [Vespa velutina]XP_047348267.1 uncharacterized protein LOC124948540 isoform X1 [Vespa velutina]